MLWYRPRGGRLLGFGRGLPPPPQKKITVGRRPLGGGGSVERRAFGAQKLLKPVPLATDCWPECRLSRRGVVRLLGPAESPPPSPPPPAGGTRHSGAPEARSRLASTLDINQMEQGPTEPHAGRSTFLLSSGGAGGGYY